MFKQFLSGKLVRVVITVVVLGLGAYLGVDLTGYVPKDAPAQVSEPAVNVPSVDAGK